MLTVLTPERCRKDGVRSCVFFVCPAVSPAGRRACALTTRDCLPPGRVCSTVLCERITSPVPTPNRKRALPLPWRKVLVMVFSVQMKSVPQIPYTTKRQHGQTSTPTVAVLGHMPTVLDVTVPPGVGAGEPVAFQDESGVTLEAIVPAGLSEGDTFQVEISDSGEATPLQHLTNYMERRAESGDVMDLFVAWFERESIGDAIDKFIEGNAHRIGTASAEEEQSHEWWPIYQEYQAQFEALLEGFLQEHGVDAAAFAAAAEGAEGMNEMCARRPPAQAYTFTTPPSPPRFVSPHTMVCATFISLSDVVFLHLCAHNPFVTALTTNEGTPDVHIALTGT